MRKETLGKLEIKLVGLSTRTNNKAESTAHQAKIGPLVGRYLSQNWASKIAHRKNPGVTLAVYTDYESNENGNYTYFIGEEVTEFENVPKELEKLVIPAAKYKKFTTRAGKMPDVVIHAWQKIWKMSNRALGGVRVYRADFEVYDQRARDPNKTVLDIYIGIQ